MSRHIPRSALALASLVCGLLTPASATAGGTDTTGGAGLGGAPTTTTPTTTTTPAAPLAGGAVSLDLGGEIWSSADGITVGVTGSALGKQLLSFSGTVTAADIGSTVLIRYASASAAGGSVQVAQATVGATGDFSVTWHADARGRLVFTATVTQPNAIPTADPPAVSFTVQVFTSSVATIYGPGIWGHRTACGERLRRSTFGVASRTLKCGTDVAVYYGDREIVVPVIDRGPYGSRARWDLTEATAKALGVEQTATIGTIEPWPRSQQLSARS
jgi:rare lipoprotein A